MLQKKKNEGVKKVAVCMVVKVRWEIICEFYWKFLSFSSGEKKFENRLRFEKLPP